MIIIANIQFQQNLYDIIVFFECYILQNINMPCVIDVSTFMPLKTISFAF